MPLSERVTILGQGYVGLPLSVRAVGVGYEVVGIDLDSERVKSIDFDAVGGLTMGAGQFAHDTAMVANRDWFVVRKEPKGRGTNRRIEGAELGPTVRVLLVDDVVTTGGSIKQAYAEIKQTGARIVAAVTLVDRGDVASNWFAEVGVPYMALLTYRDLDIEPVGDGRGDAAAAGC